MNSYEKFIDIIRKQGRHDNPAELQIAFAAEGGKIRLGGLILDTEDYYKLEQVSDLKEGDKVLIYKISDSRYILIGKVVV